MGTELVRSEPMSVQPEGQLASERVIINAPMSFAGSAQRSWRLRRFVRNPVGNVALTAVALVLISIWWMLIVAWYCIFGLLLVPYRLLRRGARKRKAEKLRHREMLAAIEQRRR